MSGKLTVSIIAIATAGLLGFGYFYVSNNPVELSINVSIGSTSTTTAAPTTSTTTTSTSTTTIAPTSTTTAAPTTSTTTTSTSTTTTTIPVTTTTIEISNENDSVTINDDSQEDAEIYVGEFTSFQGFQGENQIKLDKLVEQLPEGLRKDIEDKILFINGCHLYAKEVLGRCPLGVWDSAGTYEDGSTNSEWKLSVWISNKAFDNDVAYDALLHETSHGLSYLTRNCINPEGENQRINAQSYFGSEELFADALVLYFGGDYVYYRNNNILSNEERLFLEEYIALCCGD